MTEQWDGRPENPEQDGWRWLRTGDSVVTCEWSAARGWRDETWIVRAWELPYAGPCLTPAEVEAEKAATRREGIEAAADVASKRAASRHSTVAHCHSDRAKKHMQIRADEAGQLVAEIRALLEDGR